MSINKVALITGGSRGIGKALVEKFLENNWKVATCATSNAKLSKSNADMKFVCDIQDVNQVKKGIGLVVKKFGHIDVLINNAGIAESNPWSQNSSDILWHKIIATNLNGVYYMSKYSLPHIPKGGQIINISSVLGLKGVSDQTAYTAAKHGVIGLTKSLALFLAPKKITVNAICPGWVETDMRKKRSKLLALSKKDIERTIPLKKILSPKEVASLALYLTNKESANITGQSIIIDGGESL